MSRTDGRPLEDGKSNTAVRHRPCLAFPTASAAKTPPFAFPQAELAKLASSYDVKLDVEVFVRLARIARKHPTFRPAAMVTGLRDVISSVNLFRAIDDAVRSSCLFLDPPHCLTLSFLDPSHCRSLTFRCLWHCLFLTFPRWRFHGRFRCSPTG